MQCEEVEKERLFDNSKKALRVTKSLHKEFGPRQRKVTLNLSLSGAQCACMGQSSSAIFSLLMANCTT